MQVQGTARGASRSGSLGARLAGVVAGIALAASAGGANALVITADGAALGFTTAPVVTGFPFNGLGPIGLTVMPDGNILVNSTADRTNYVFANANDQTFADHIGRGTPGGAFCCGAYATANGWAWGGNGGALVRFNNDGTIAQTYGIGVSNGMWTNPVNGHLLIANGVLRDVDVSDIANPVSRTILDAFQHDGLTVSPDGKIVYTSKITGYDIATGAVVFDHPINGGDGMGVISSKNGLDGLLVVNTLLGDVVLVDPNGGHRDVVIATQGGRGDYVTPDPSTGSLLLTSGADIWRLSCGQGCGIGVEPPDDGGGGDAAEPSVLALLGLSLATIGIGWRRRK